MKHPRRTIVALLSAIVVALGVVAPSVAHAADGEPNVTLYAIENCTECGLDHYGWDVTTAGGLEVFDKKIDYAESSDRDVVSAAVVPTSDGEGSIIEFHAMKPGSATVSVHYKTPEGEAIAGEVNTITVKVVSVSDPTAVPSDRQGLINHSNAIDVYRLRVEINDPSGGLDAGWITSDKLFEQSFAATLTENKCNYQLGEKVQFGDTTTHIFQGWRIPGSGLSVDDIPVKNEYTFSEVSTSTDPLTGVTYTFHDQLVEATWNPSPETGVWEPWAPGEGSVLLPYTRTSDDGVLTFDDVDELGEWYKLDFRCGEGVSYNGIVAGGTSRTMTIERPYLAADDPLYNSSASEGPVWSRGDHGDDRTSVAFSIPADGTVSYRLEPADAGALYMQSIGEDQLILGVQLSKPATLVVEPSDTTTITNEQGATLTAPANPSNPTYYNRMALKTEHIGGDVAQTAVDSVVAMIDDVTGHPYVFDISMIDPAGKEIQPLDGDTVTVTLPIPEGLSAEGLHVFHVADDGTVTDMNATVDAEAGTVSFTTTHFSTFVLANVKADKQPVVKDPSDDVTTGTTTDVTGDDAGNAGDEKTEDLAKTGDPGSALALLAALSGSATLAGSVALRRRR